MVLNVRCGHHDHVCQWLARMASPMVDLTVTLPLPPFKGHYVVSPEDAARSRSPASPAPPPSPSSMPPKPPTVVLYTEEGSYFGQRPWPLPSWHNRTCRQKQAEAVLVVRWPSHDRSRGLYAAAGAHVRVFHSPDWQSARAVAARRASPRDVLVHYSLESPLMWPADLNPEYMSNFELHQGYSSARATAWQSYLPPLRSMIERLRRPPHRVPWARKNASRLLVTAVSNCHDYAGRTAYLRALRDALGERFINLGSCVPSGPRMSRDGSNERAVISAERTFISRGFFYLALENANCEDYITEKLGRALLSGVVPVVFDAPQSLAGGTANGLRVPGYDRVLPPRTYVNVADFASASELAAHLEQVAANRTLYASYLWPHYVSTAELLKRWPQHRYFRSGEDERAECKLARAALASVRRANRTGRPQPRLEPDASCMPPGQLCRFLPNGRCQAGTVADRVAPEDRMRPSNGRRSPNSHTILRSRNGRLIR